MIVIWYYMVIYDINMIFIDIKLIVYYSLAAYIFFGGQSWEASRNYWPLESWFFHLS